MTRTEHSVSRCGARGRHGRAAGDRQLRHCCSLASRTIPAILGEALASAESGPPAYRRRDPSPHPHRFKAVATASIASAVASRDQESAGRLSVFSTAPSPRTPSFSHRLSSGAKKVKLRRHAPHVIFLFVVGAHEPGVPASINNDERQLTLGSACFGRPKR